MIKIGIMQPYFLPYLGYWQLINIVDKYVIYDDVNFIKKGWINRNRILINKQSNWFTLKLSDASQNKKINEVFVLDDKNYFNKLIRTVYENYKKAPYFNDVFPLINDIIENPERNLAKYLEFSIKKICDYLEIKTELIISSDLEKNNSLKGKDKIIEICKKLNGQEYYNSIGGCELYSKDEFQENGIDIKFLKTKNILYKQFNITAFTENLSILDVMMFNSKDEIKLLLGEYEII